MYKLPLVLFATLLLVACSHLPQSLQSSAENVLTNYSAWGEDTPNAAPVRLGGVIAKVTNLKDKTRVEVVNLPIGSNGKPDINEEPSGRFVAYVDGFADPVTLSEGRLITLLGVTMGEESGQVGEYNYTFPVMKSSGYHLWRIEERVIVREFDSYLYPCRGLHCRTLQPTTKQGTVIQQVK